MAELVPIPLPLLLRRAFLEYQREAKVFDLPKSRFFRGIPGLDLAVDVHGHRAATPLGPAAGPHGQLAQNIVLSWLGGSRIIELKTIQVLDELKIPRPCIDAANVGYNVEWSQELKLEQSLREYVCAAMFLEVLKASRLLGDDWPASLNDTVFDMSVGYNLEGICSPRVRSWIASMKNARQVIDELRPGLTGQLAPYRELDFPARISDTVSLSTFHGCPAREIESIATFLLSEMQCHVCIKMNPTLLGKAEVEHLLRGVLGYREIQLDPQAFERDLQFDEAVDLIPRLQHVARQHNRGLSVKFSNTLVVKNHRQVFSEERMYLSGPPLHVLAMNLVQRFRERLRNSVPTSFSAGLDAHNMAQAVAMNLVPVTVCTDLLRPGGYSRLVRYLENLGEQMKHLGVTRIPDFVVRYGGRASAAIDRIRNGLSAGAEARLRDWLEMPHTPLESVCSPGARQALVEAAGLLNTPAIVAEATANPRYAWERNHGVPRKIGSNLWLYDCINCDKCVPACPNDANFVYQAAAEAIPYDNFELLPGRVRRVLGGVLRLVKARQLANYADACNECGNCDIFCPEDGGPFHAKPRFFGSLESYRKHAGGNGFYVEPGKIYGAIDGESYMLTLDLSAGTGVFTNAADEVQINLSDNEPTGWKSRLDIQAGMPVPLDMLPYLKLKVLLASISDPRHVNFANVASLQEVRLGNEESAI